MGMIEARERFLAEYGESSTPEDAFDAGYEVAMADLEDCATIEGRRQADYIHGVKDGEKRARS